MKIELYIDKQLCDIGNPDKFSVYLRRQLYNPSELNTKDAQASYTVTLPTSANNNRIFGFANVEEVRGKFERLYEAQLIVNGIRIFDGKFKLSEVTASDYKGNLGIPAPKTVKEIFGDKNMNELGKWELKTSGLKDPETNSTYIDAGFMTYYNKQETPDCIFPFALYGLLPKVPKEIYTEDETSEINPEIDTYTPKNIIDKTVRFGIEDFPPSVNCLKMLKTLFSNAEYSLSGTAFQDERLKNLYVSYKNPNDYVQPWNWGLLGTMDIHARWSTSTINIENPNKPELIPFNELVERQYVVDRDEYSGYFSVNLFNSNRLEVIRLYNPGGNLLYRSHKDKYKDGYKGIDFQRKNLQLIIPQSGYYKVTLECTDFTLDEKSKNLYHTDTPTGNKIIGVRGHDGKFYNSFIDSRYEMQVLRDYGQGDFNLRNIVGRLRRPQFPQEPWSNQQQFPKYYPRHGGALVVDPSMNPNFICGLHWGQHSDDDDNNPDTDLENSDPDKRYCYYMFIANGFSWDKTFSQKQKILSAYDSSFYKTNNYRDTDNYLYYGIDKEEEEIVTEPDRFFKPMRLGILGNYPPKDPYDNSAYAPTSKITQLVNPDKEKIDNTRGQGTVESVIWLEKGERITVGIVGDLGDRGSKSWDQWIVRMTNVEFRLSVHPLYADIEWNTFRNDGSYNPSKIMDMRASPTFRNTSLNLTEFLPSDRKADDWIENFCKAFNLSLVQSGEKEFELNVKQKELVADTAHIIDLDSRVHIVHRTNQSLALPSKYTLGFNINTDEEGYRESLKENEAVNLPPVTGGGAFHTGSHETSDVSQASSFSYCWYKTLTDKTQNNEKKIRLPVISDHEVWKKDEEDYPEMIAKTYFDKSQRFWYKTELYPVKIGYNLTVLPNDNPNYNGIVEQEIQLALVSNTYEGNGKLVLDYENKPDSILKNYFYLLDNSSEYTDIECLLTPEEYDKLNISLVKLNGDLYHPISIDGYDPTCKKPAKIRLIRKTV